MIRYAFDIETDGLCRQLTRAHCLVIQDIDTGEVFKYDDSGNHSSLIDGVKALMTADELWGHNIIGYDNEALIELYPFFKDCKAKFYDTLILSRLFFTDMLDRDFRSKPALMPANLYGRHSLESWGHRLNIHKSEFGKSLKGDWSTYTPEMLAYCAQDVAVSVALSKMFMSKLDTYKECIDLELEIAHIMAWQEREGWTFDIAKAHKLESKLRTELDKLSDEMQSTFLFVDGGRFTPKRSNKTSGYVEGAEFTRLKQFNPTSRQHIAWAFKTFRNWEPIEYTATGIAKIDESVLKQLNTNESNSFARILELQKHLGQLSEGKNAWLKKVESDGKIHHSCSLNTNTGRQSHVRPNIAQVPSDKVYRELFTAGSGRTQVGTDASGLELRCLGHYLSRFDKGKFAKEVVEGDIHSELAKIYGTDRNTGKGVTYCLIYGGGNMKLGLTAGEKGQAAAAKGKKIRGRILEGLTGYKELSAAVAHRAESGVLRGLDGRPIRLQGRNHAALNYLLQSAGAVICKKWVIETHRLFKLAHIDYIPLGFIHDEQQLSIAPKDVEAARSLTQTAMKNVEKELNFRCALDSESMQGDSWGDTH
nr:DNA polymerase [uncultured Mediterranean phage uvMED]